jgi:hypothetical protein
LQLRFLSHFSSEPVCALNDVRVYGKSAVEDLEDQLALEAPADEEDAPQQQALPQAVQAQADALPDGQASDDVSSGHHRASDTATGLQVTHPSAAVHTPDPAPNGPSIAAPDRPAPDHNRTAGGLHADDTGIADAANSGQGARPVAESQKTLAVSMGVEQSEAVPPILDALGASIMRLITPPGAGKKRSTYAGSAADLDNLPLPAPPQQEPARPEQLQHAAVGKSTPDSGSAFTQETDSADVLGEPADKDTSPSTPVVGDSNSNGNGNGNGNSNSNSPVDISLGEPLCSQHK